MSHKKGVHVSPETEFKKGHTPSQETRDKIGRSSLGRTPWNKGLGGTYFINKPKICKTCKKQFQPRSSLQKYCSIVCSNLDTDVRKKKGTIITCRVCGKEIYITKCFIGVKKYCSYKCSHKGQEHHMLIKCKICGKEVKKYHSQKRLRGATYCSYKCQHLGQRSKTAKKEQLDTLWSEAIRLKAKKKCEYCSTTTKQLNAHHLFSRGNLSTRWSLENGMCLCASHHILGNFSAHKSPLEFSEWIIEKIGREKYDELKFKAHQAEQPDYEKIKEYLDTNLDRLRMEFKENSNG